jgi:exodeoxyribonuclease VII large subunit
MQEIVFTPAYFVAAVNQTLEFAFPTVIIEGELSNFKISKNRWVYFDLKDEEASVRFFGTVYSLPGPLEDGMTVRVVGSPSLHPRFGFSVNFRSILPVGEGELKKAADLLFKQLEREGLFAPERKRPLPYIPQKIGLITAADSAAAADFTKILKERWGGVEVLLADVYVQGEQAPLQIIQALDHINQLSEVPEVLVITRGGGSAEDLAAFNDERLVRAIAASRIPTLVAIGHEVDVSLAELAADQRASTPTNAAQILVPDKKSELVALTNIKSVLKQSLESAKRETTQQLKMRREFLAKHLSNLLAGEHERIKTSRRLISLYDPRSMLARGYALVSAGGKTVKSIKQLKASDIISVKLTDGTIKAVTKEILKDG